MAEAVVYDEIKPMESAPDDERPARAMPKAAEQHGGDQIEVASHGPFSVATQGNIEVVAQKTGQGYVPAPPKVDD